MMVAKVKRALVTLGMQITFPITNLTSLNNYSNVNLTDWC